MTLFRLFNAHIFFIVWNGKIDEIDDIVKISEIADIVKIVEIVDLVDGSDC